MFGWGEPEHMKLIFGIISILLIGSFSGCIEITSRNGNLFSNENNQPQPWADVCP